MKIYYIANARMPTDRAHGIQLAKMCEAFRAKGADLELVVPNRRTKIQESVGQFYGLSHVLAVKKLPVIDLYNWGRWGFIIGSFSFMLSCFLYILSKRVRKRKGIIYTIDMDAFSFLAIPFIGLPYFMEMHNAKPKSIAYKFFFKYASGLVVINQIIKDKLIQTFGISDKKIIVHPNGIDIQFFSSLLSREEARHALNLSTSGFIALYVGRFYDWKGLEIFTSLGDFSKKDILFYIVGGTKKEFERVTGQALLPGVICAGRKNYKEIPLWLAAADMFIVLGTKKNEYSYFHTSPMKLFEYMAARRPVVASRTPAIREIVSENEVVFYEPDNPGDLVNKIETVMDNGPETQEMVKNAYEKVQDFSWDKRGEGVLQFISKNT